MNYYESNIDEDITNEVIKNNQEKSSDLVTAESEPSDGVDTSPSNEIIQENIENSNIDENRIVKEEFNFETEEKPIQPLSLIQQVDEKSSASLTSGKPYRSVVTDIKTEKYNTGTEAVMFIHEIDDGTSISINVPIPLYFNDNPKCVKTSLDKLKKMAKMYNLEINRNDLRDVDSIAKACKSFIGIKSIIEQSERGDYKNYEIISTERQKDWNES